jgi:hypothetical protein
MKKILLTAATAFVMSLAASAQFTGSFSITLTGDKVKEPVEMNYYVKPSMIAMEMPSMKEKGFVKTIINKDAHDITTCMDNKGNKMAMRQKMSDKDYGPKSDESVKITKTGETKTIDGYKCEKVIVESDQATSECWMTTDVKVSMQDIMGAMASRNAKQYQQKMPQGYDKLEGVSIETATTNKKSGEKSNVKVHDIKIGKVDDAMFSIEGYQMMEMPPMPMMEH